MNQLKTKKRDKFKKIEHYLRNYKHYKTGIRNLQKQLDYLLPGITADYEIKEGSIGSFTFKSKTEFAAIDRIEGKRALQIHEDIMLYKIIIEAIEDGLRELDDYEREFVEYRYFEGWSFNKAASEMGYTERNLFHMRSSILDKLLISMKNIDLLGG